MSNSVLPRNFLWILFLSVICFGLIFCSNTRAGMLESIIKDFSPVSGVVVMVRDGEFIIDLDASAGLTKGDLLSVVSRGEKVVHPVTGAVLGHMDDVKGILKVTRIKDGFSYTRGLQIQNISIGDAVRRYENIRAVFWDYTGEGKAIFLRLRDDIPHLKWMDFEKAQQARPKDPWITPETELAVVFILKENGLQVRDSEFLIIREYPFAEPMDPQKFLSYSKEEKSVIMPVAPEISKEQDSKTTYVAPEKGTKTKATMESAISSPGSTQAIVPVFPATSKREISEGVKPVFQDSELIDKLPGGPVMMADFMPHENGLLLASTDGQKIHILTVSDTISMLVEKDSPLYGPVLSLSWWKPQQSEWPMLAVVNWMNHKPSSSLFALENNRLRLLKDRIPRFIAAFDTNGDRVPDMLLGQEYDPQDFFSYRIQEIKWIGNDIEYQKPSVKLPKRFTIFGGLLSDLTGNGVSEAAFIRNEILYVYSEKEPLYKSSKKMGGSLSTLLYETNPTAKHIITNSVSIEIPPVAVDLDGDGINELITVASDRSLLSKTGISHGIEGTWLTVLKYENKIFKEGTIGEKMSTPIQGMTVFGDKLFLVVSETGSVFSKGGQSRLLQLPLAH